MENGTWRNSPIPPPILSPANDTKLSISTVLVPRSPTVNGGFSLPLVSSVLTYISTNISKTTTLVSGETFPPSNIELSTTFNSPVEPDYSPVNSSSAGIASLVNIFTSNVSNGDYSGVNLYSRFSIGANYHLHSWSINDFNYYYNLFMLGNPVAAEVSASGKSLQAGNTVLTNDYSCSQILRIHPALQPIYLYFNFLITQLLKSMHSQTILLRSL